MDPQGRPSAAQIYETFSKYRSVRKAVKELPRKLVLQILGVKLSLNEPGQRRVYVKLMYGNNFHTTPLTGNAMAGGEYKWLRFAYFYSRYIH